MKNNILINLIFIFLLLIMLPIYAYSLLYSNPIIEYILPPSDFLKIYYSFTLGYIALFNLSEALTAIKGNKKVKSKVISISVPEKKVESFLFLEIEVNFKNHVNVTFEFNKEKKNIIIKKDVIVYDLEDNEEPYIEFTFNKYKNTFSNIILHNKKQQ